MALLRSRLTMAGLALVVVAASLGFFAWRTLPASSHGNVTVLQCSATGTGGDLADSRGIQFNVSQSFVSVDVRMDATSAGVYAITAELRRSTGFTGPISAASRSGVSLPGTSGTTPYPYVHFDFPLQGVFIPNTSFTLKFVDITGPGTLYIEASGFADVCSNVMETNENNVAVPTERGDPTGFTVSTLRTVQWGDVDCSDGAPSATDALKILRKVAGLVYTQTQPCPALGDLVRP